MKAFLLTLAFLIGMLTAWPMAAPMAQPADVKGWQDTYWGMTPDELIDVYGNRLIKGEYCYRIENYKIFEKDFIVYFCFENNALYRVDVGYASNTNDRHLGKLVEASLKSKYGKFETTQYEEKPFSCTYLNEFDICDAHLYHDFMFTFNSTIITYSLYYSKRITNIKGGSGTHTILSIFYKPNQAGKL